MNDPYTNSVLVSEVRIKRVFRRLAGLLNRSHSDTLPISRLGILEMFCDLIIFLGASIDIILMQVCNKASPFHALKLEALALSLSNPLKSL
jgi:hypothetical protein